MHQCGDQPAPARLPSDGGAPHYGSAGVQPLPRWVCDTSVGFELVPASPDLLAKVIRTTATAVSDASFVNDAASYKHAPHSI